jgi:D-arginine dehydrogenase
MDPVMVLADVEHAGERNVPEYTLISRFKARLYACRQDFQPSAFPRHPDAAPVSDALTAAIARDCGNMASGVRGSAPRRVRAGYLAITPDQMPVIGPSPELQGLVYCAGFNGFGVGWSAGAGLAVAELLLDGWAASVDLSPFDPVRFA